MNTRFRKSAIFVLLSLATPTGSLFAQDQLFLNNGAITGGTQLAEDKVAAVVSLQLDNGVKIKLPASKVVVSQAIPDDKRRKAQEAYKAHVGDLKDEAASHTKIIDYLNSKGLGELAAAHYQRLVELDPENRPAWRALRYSNSTGGWIPSERFQKSKGMMREGTRWRTPQDVAMSKVIEDRKRASSVMKRDIDKHLREYDSEGKRGDEARAFFSGLTDATALPIMTDKILDKETSEDTALMLLETVFRLNARSINEAVVKILVTHNSQRVQTRCLDYLQDHPSEAAIQQLLHYLKNKNPLEDRPETYNRVGNALELIGDDRCIPPLVDMLVTKHQRMQGNGANTNFGVNSNGGMSMSQGTPKAVERNIQNAGILAALNSISGENFGYDKEAWKEWYAHHSADTNLELRRDL